MHFFIFVITISNAEIVKEVKVVGNTRVSSETIVVFGDIRINEDYNAQTIGIILLWLSAFLTLYTGYEYLRKGIDHAISEDEKN